MTQYQEQVPRWQRGALLRFYLAFLAHQKKGLRGFLTIFQPDLCWDDYPIAGNGRPGSSLASKKGVLVDDL